MKSLFILGVDPGTTIGYAVLDIEGNLIRLKSARDLSVERLIQEVSNVGKIIIIGVDVKHSPKYVERICRILGAKLFSPQEDVKEGFKDRLTENFRVKDDHQRDALASALMAFGRVKEMFSKVDQRLKERGKEHWSDEVKIHVLHGLSVDDALQRLEKKEIIPKKRKRVRSPPKTSRIAEENEALRKELLEVRRRYEGIRKKFMESKAKIDNIVEIKLRKNLEIQKRNMQATVNQLETMQKELEALKKDITLLREVVTQTPKKEVLKHFPTLEFHHMKDQLAEGEMIVVENPNKWNEKSLEYLEQLGIGVLWKQQPSHQLQARDITWIELNKIPYKEVQNLVIAEKHRIEKERENHELLNKIVQEYKKKRGTLQ
ncbi:MAG: DUF460 domain-containing protein [Nanoarchaeota archaeon]